VRGGTDCAGRGAVLVNGRLTRVTVHAAAVDTAAPSSSASAPSAPSSASAPSAPSAASRYAYVDGRERAATGLSEYDRPMIPQFKIP